MNMDKSTHEKAALAAAQAFYATTSIFWETMGEATRQAWFNVVEAVQTELEPVKFPQLTEDDYKAHREAYTGYTYPSGMRTAADTLYKLLIAKADKLYTVEDIARAIWVKVHDDSSLFGPNAEHYEIARAVLDFLNRRGVSIESKYREITREDVHKGMTVRAVYGDLMREGVAFHQSEFGDWFTRDWQPLTAANRWGLSTPVLPENADYSSESVPKVESVSSLIAFPTENELGKVIWDTFRYGEGAISLASANNVASAVLSFLGERVPHWDPVAPGAVIKAGTRYRREYKGGGGSVDASEYVTGVGFTAPNASLYHYFIDPSTVPAEPEPTPAERLADALRAKDLGSWSIETVQSALADAGLDLTEREK